MKKLVIISLLLCFTILSCIKSKEVLIRNYNLSSHLSEISGLVRIDNRYFAHNDGGDEANLYEIDIKTGEILRTILLIGAQNIDWEDIARDSQFIYVGDIGGNNSAREDLTVYKVDINRLLNYDEVNPEIIVIKKSSARNLDHLIAKFIQLT
jgi:hypothetical protein